MKDKIEILFKEFEDNVKKLMKIEKDLHSLDIEGFEPEFNAIKSKLRSPKKIPEIEKEILELRNKIAKKAKARKTEPLSSKNLYDLTSEKIYAVIIGLSNFQDQRIPNLSFTRADAEAISKVLEDKKKLGIKKDNIKVLLDKDATLANIKNSINNWLYKKVDKKSIIFIFIAGHGGVEPDKFNEEPDGLAKYLISYDSNIEDLCSTALSTHEFNRLLRPIKYKRLIIFMDTCYSGGVCRPGARDVKITENPYNTLGGEGRVIIAASKPDQRSYEDKDFGHGIFTYYLEKALNGEADYDNNGVVSADEIYRYLREKVPKSVKKKHGALQEPMIVEKNVAGDFAISIDRDRLNALNQQKIIDSKLLKLWEYRDSGEIDGKVYGRLRRVLKTDPEKLSGNGKKIATIIEDFHSEDVYNSIEDFLEDLKRLDPDLFKERPKKRNREKKDRI